MNYRCEYDEVDKSWYIYWDKHFLNPLIFEGLEREQAECLVALLNDLYERLKDDI